MKFKTWVNSMNESLKDNELNRILDKMSDGNPLSDNERKFLSMFDKSTDDDYKDFKYLTLSDTFNKIKSILEKDKNIICDLYIKNKIGLRIVSIYTQFDDESCYIELEGGSRIELKDNYLYNIVYDIRKDEYSLQSQDEYHEKIPVKDEN